MNVLVPTRERGNVDIHARLVPSAVPAPSTMPISSSVSPYSSYTSPSICRSVASICRRHSSLSAGIAAASLLDLQVALEPLDQLLNLSLPFVERLCDRHAHHLGSA